MKKLIVASNNEKKIKEIKEILNDIPLEVKSLKDEKIDIDVIEDGSTFEENAEKKVREIYEFLKLRGDKEFIVLSDDSGLEVDYLNGEPGIYSARYSGEHGNDSANNDKLLAKMINAKGEERKARFVCSMALITSDSSVEIIRGTVEGYIINELSGKGGFGYDPLFYYEPFKKTFGETTSEEKNSISHRGKALSQMKEIIRGIV